MLINLRNALMSGKRLPYDAELEYLESTGTQYINTGLNYFADFEVGIKLRTSVPNKALGTGISTCLQRYSANNPYWDLSISGRSYRSSASIVDYHVMSWKGGVFAADGVVAQRVSNPFTDGTMTLFGAGGQYYPNMIYACKLWDANGTLVRDFVPVRKGTVGYLYDRVSGKLFGNAGTGDFVLGADVVPVEYIESHGTEWIDTGVVYKSAPRILLNAMITSGGDRDIAGTSLGDGCFIIDMYLNRGSHYWLYYRYGKTTAYTFYSGGIVGSAIGWEELINSWHAYDFSKTVTVDGAQIPSSSIVGDYDFSSNTLSIMLFRARTYGLLRISFCKIWDGNTSVRSFRPVRVGTEGAMMDVLTRRIYRNAGTGAFTYGNDLKYPIPAE